jgi:hypothetical protein
MNLSIYSDKSFVITGNTKEHKIYMKEMGGRWNANLSCGSGWIFSLTKKKEMEDWLAKQQQPESLPAPTRFSPSLSLADDFIAYIKPYYNDKKNIMDILYDFSTSSKQNHKFTEDDDDVSLYFNNDNTKLYQYFFSFIKNASISYAVYKDIDKDKFIEYALIQLAK